MHTPPAGNMPHNLGTVVLGYIMISSGAYNGIENISEKSNLIPNRLSQFLTCENLEKYNHRTIAKLFNDSLSLIWPKNIQNKQVLLFMIDAAPYMTNP